MKANQSLGAIMKELVQFSLPLILSGVMQQLYNWVDAFVVGNVDGELSLSAIGSTTTPINFFITTITGFTLGLSVLVAKNFGAKKRDNIPPILALFSVFLGIVFIIVAISGSIMSYQFMKLLHTPSDTIDLASNYIRIVFIGLPFLAIYNVYNATLRAIGDSRIPFLSILFSSIMNVFLDVVFVALLGLGVHGAAFATILSQVAMTVFIIIYGTRKYPWLASGYHKRNFDIAIMAEGFRFGFPPMLQSSITSLGGLMLQDFMNRFGTDTVTAITTAYRIDTLVMLPIVNLGSGISTITAQSCGSGNQMRARNTLISGIMLTLLVSLILTIIVIPTGAKIIGLFGAGTTAVMIGDAFFKRIACFYPIFGLDTAFRGYFEGRGNLVYSSVVGIACLLVRILASYAMAPWLGNMSIPYAEIVSWVCMFLMYLLRFVNRKSARCLDCSSR